MDKEEKGANMMEEMANNLMDVACPTENSSINEGGLVEENFFEEPGSGGDFTQWEDLWVAMALLVAMAMAIMTLLGVFLLLVGIMSRLLGQDLTRDPRYTRLKIIMTTPSGYLAIYVRLSTFRNYANGPFLNMQQVIDGLLFEVFEVSQILNENFYIPIPFKIRKQAFHEICSKLDHRR